MDIEFFPLSIDDDDDDRHRVYTKKIFGSFFC